MIRQKIKQIRLQKKFTQDEMATALHISQNAYSLLESGKTKIDEERIYQIAKVLDVHPFELFENSDLDFNFNNKTGNNYIDNNQEPGDHNKELIQTLKEQLAIKDRQIEELLKYLKQAS